MDHKISLEPSSPRNEKVEFSSLEEALTFRTYVGLSTD